MLIRLVLTEIQAFKNEKNLQRNVSKCEQIGTRASPHLVKVQQEGKVAKTTALLTLVMMSSYTPSIVIEVLGYRDPTLRQSVFFIWTQVFLQLNSIANPFVYCFRNRQFRNAVLELLTMRSTKKAVENCSNSYKTDASFKLVRVKAQPKYKFRKLPTDASSVPEEKWRSPKTLRKRKSRGGQVLLARPGCSVYIQ